MSTMPSRAIDQGEIGEWDETWTYQDDAKLIKKLGYAQVIVLVICLITANIGCCTRAPRDAVFGSEITNRSNKSKQRFEPVA